MKNPIRLTTAAVVLTLSLSACGGGPAGTDAAGGRADETDPAPDTTQITITAFDFQPMEVTVQAGEKVVWENQDDILHTVTSGKAQEQGVPGVTENTDAQPDGKFDGDLDGVGATFGFTFEESGTFDYFCSIHPGMVGTVTVR